MRAAEQASAAAAHEEALACLDEALALWEGEPSARTADLEERRGQALRSLSRADEAIEAYRRAVSAWTAAHNTDRAAAALWEGCYLRVWRMELQAARADLTAALAWPGLSAASRASLLCGEAAVSALAGDVQAGLQALREAETLYEPGVHPGLDVAMLACRCRCEQIQMHASATVARGREWAAYCASRGNVWDEVEATWESAVGLVYLGHVEEALLVLDEADAKAARVGHYIGHSAIAVHQSMARVAQGDMAAAERHAREGRERCRHVDSAIVAFAFDLALATFAIWEGREAEGLALGRAAAERESDRTALHSAHALVLRNLAMVDPAEARAAHRAGPEQLRRPGDLATEGFWVSLACLVEALAHLELRDDLLALVPVVDELAAGEIVFPFWTGLPSAALAGIVCRWAEQWEPAEAHFARALD